MIAGVAAVECSEPTVRRDSEGSLCSLPATLPWFLRLTSYHLVLSRLGVDEIPRPAEDSRISSFQRRHQQGGIAEQHELHSLEENAWGIPIGVGAKFRQPLVRVIVA